MGSWERFENIAAEIENREDRILGIDEFEGAQLVGKVQIPNAKWNEADYLEVLTKSFPKWGDGGASQFITKSSIKIKRLRNLETGEIIDF